jgi:hypothetical protein
VVEQYDIGRKEVLKTLSVLVLMLLLTGTVSLALTTHLAHGVSFSTIVLDQHLESETCSDVISLPYMLDNGRVGQTFEPSLPVLCYIAIKIYADGDISGLVMTLYVREGGMNGSIVTSATVSNASDWIVFDFPDINVTIDSVYAWEIVIAGGCTGGQPMLYLGGDDQYARGAAYALGGGGGGNFLFRTYGSTSPPQIFAIFDLTIVGSAGGTTGPEPGTYSLINRTRVDVTAYPNEYSKFDHWEFDSVNIGSANPCTVLMDNDHKLHAVFLFPIGNITGKPTVYLTPSDTFFDLNTGYVGKKFNVTVSVQNVPDLGEAIICIGFNDSVIMPTRWFMPTWDPNFFMPRSPFTCAYPEPPDPGYAHLSKGSGSVQISVFKGGLPPMAPWGHNGTIAIIEFNITAAPPKGVQFTSFLQMGSTTLCDPTGLSLPNTVIQDGSYTFSGIGARSKTVVDQGYSVNINVTLTDGPTYSVIVCANTTVVGLAHLTIPSGGTNTVVIAWNTTRFAKGNYIISLLVNDTTFSDGSIFLSIPGDVNGDRKTNLIDVFSVALAFGSCIGDPRYKPNLDINGDGKIDLTDYFTTALNFGKSW